MKTKRGFIDYSLDKRATLLALFRGVVDACDADPYLIRAAKYHGEKAGRNCPVCKKDSLVELRYTFGDQLGQFSGRIKNGEELLEMENEFGEFAVYVVEVCRDCSWNHLSSTYLLCDLSRRRRAFQRPGDGRVQVLAADRLGDVVVHTGGHGIEPVLGKGTGA